ncbi:germ cell-less protein-like 1 [Cricetulus griseus]|uniref:Germ cell-less protein-like 1 n=1 Tax=Cricetulus griseus TaxID=10029 RepID=G3IKR4_CRIGR|nr:germ cell-less protein-like 1 [Cricetulus griseus]XP_027287712.1 germ cell-less protein-like 1 [Cricetulus griseus]XP_035305626.1 germ cell-less protein-like 1 [Cricetulus griseus]EGV91510.1 Germ cell-less protein-like 1 [Cricetulus griseus]EGW13736.1 Germ cell-less protein-like 1 [Cricetulus griseus]
MGTVSSLMRLRGNPPAEEAPAAGDGEAAEAGPAFVREEQGVEQARITTRRVGRKRSASPAGPSAKLSRESLPQDTAKSPFRRRGESDVKICAFGEEWCLHKCYLCRSGYFASMFSGAWRETDMTTIEMQMPDENIDRESFYEALVYLYSNSIPIPPHRIIAVLSTACMLQLDEVIQQCEEMMKASLTADTVCSYYYSAEDYGLQCVQSVCRQWLLDNLMTRQNDEILQEINLDLMKELVASSDLLVFEVEIDLYTILKKWMFLQLEPTWSGSPRELLTAADLCFAKCKSDANGAPFLETDQGRAFVSVFQRVRLPYIICDLPSAQIIDHDALIPASWVSPIYKDLWLALLRAEQSRELGPVDIHVSDVSGTSMRCAGQLQRDEQCSWTWSGFNFGWDLVVQYINRRIIFRRSALNKSCGFGVSLLWQRKIAFRLRVISLDTKGTAVLRRDTNYHVLCLRKDQELEVISLENEDIIFPMYVACNFLYLPGGSGHSRESGRSPRR